MKVKPTSFNKVITIGNKKIRQRGPVFIIAEAGVAHFKDLKKAFQLVDLAVDAKASAVKFQIFKTEKLISAASGEWRRRLQSKELPFSDFSKIKEYCHRRGIIFLATAHDEESLAFADTLDVAAYKIGSGEVGNWPFIQKVALRKKPILLSTGMYTLDDISHALKVIVNMGNRNVVVLHCVTQYPVHPDEVNLRAMDTIRAKFGVLVGYSDHTQGFHFPLAAAARGACVIEKHITLDFNVPDAQDWKVSCGPDDFPLMVRQIKEIKTGLGTGKKNPSKNEQSSIQWARKSIVAKTDIKKGDFLTSDKLCCKRPGVGIIPSDIKKIIGKKAKHTIRKDTLIKWGQLV
ncbi:MAG: N-acetylneuraminate synthase family protein [Candidatus Omnitrophota bacterium]|nr:MAG: N-acetylneuraminate synthase family protein [Candidatus Omnitrophota bacterium]